VYVDEALEVDKTAEKEVLDLLFSMVGPSEES